MNNDTQSSWDEPPKTVLGFVGRILGLIVMLHVGPLIVASPILTTMLICHYLF